LPLLLGFWLISGSTLGPIGGLSVRQFNSYLPRTEDEEDDVIGGCIIITMATGGSTLAADCDGRVTV